MVSGKDILSRVADVTPVAVLVALAAAVSLLCTGCSDNRQDQDDQPPTADRTPPGTTPAPVPAKTDPGGPDNDTSGPQVGMGRLRGRLVDNLADPIVGAEVMLQSAQARAQLLVPATGDRPPHAHTDMAGRFTLDHPPGTRLLLVVHHPYLQSQLLRRDLRLVAGRTLDLGDMELASAPGLVVAVRARESQQPLAGARVQLAPALEDATLPALALSTRRREAYTAANGRAALYGVSAGAYTLRVEAPGRATVEVSHQQPATVERALRIPVELRKGLVLRGVVLSQDQPATGAHIVCTPHGGRLSHVATTDARGEFQITGMLAQGYWLMVTHPQHGPLVQDPVVPDGRTLTLKLPPGHAVSGRVLDSVSRRPVHGARVVVRPASGWPLLQQGRLQQPTTVTDAEGHFRIGGLPAGIVFVVAASQGFFSMEHGPIQPDSGPVTLLLRAGFRVTGKVQDPAGQPMRAALVEVIHKQQPGTANRRLLAGIEAGPKSLPQGTTGSSGRFDLGGLPPGDYRLLVRKNGLPPFLSPAFVAGAKGTKDLGILQVLAGGRIHGVATDRSGQPAAGATVCLDPLSGQPPETAGAKAVCDVLGRFALGPVAPGWYEMFYYSPGRQTAAEAAASRNATLVQVQVSDREDLTRNLHPRSR
ncbi:MAG: MSCRAMM family protein [Planctomycetota bacterium]|jgi:hypothetical protein